MFASTSRKLNKNTLRGKKMQGSYVLTIVQLLNQLKNANSCITQNYPDPLPPAQYAPLTDVRPLAYTYTIPGYNTSLSSYK